MMRKKAIEYVMGFFAIYGLGAFLGTSLIVLIRLGRCV